LSWLSGWQYRKQHVIEGSSAGAVTDYQIRIVVHYGSGTDSGEDVYLNEHCRTDFGDVRFTDSDGITELPYWMEEKVDGDYAVFWVKVPSISASPDTTTIYIYYGNPTATTTSDGENTFLFFDDFLGTDLDLTKWNVISGVVTVSNSIVTVQGADIRTITTYGPNKRILSRAKHYADDYYQDPLELVNDAETDWLFFRRDSVTAEGSYWVTWTRAEGVDTKLGHSAPELNVWHRYEATWKAGEVKFYRNDVLLDTHTTNVPTATDLRARFLSAGNNPQLDVDWIAIGKYVDPEPSHGAWGSEETAAVTLSVSVLNESLDKSRGIAGETVTYTATVQDENGDALPSTFKVTLKIDGTILIQDQPLTSDVYDPATKKLTLQWTVPAMSTLHTVKLSWSEQTIDTTTYSAGESAGVEFEIISVPALTSEQIRSVSLTLIVCLIFISFETAKEMAENMV